MVELAYAPGATGTEVKRTLAEDFAGRAQDANPRMRLLAMRELARNQDAASADAVLKAALKAPPNDPYYEYTAWLSINDLAEPWSKAVLAGEWKIDSAEREQQLVYALNALDPAVGAPVLSRVLEGRELPADGSGPWLQLIAKAGGKKELGLILAGISSAKMTPAGSTQALGALLEANRLRNVRPEGDLAVIEPLLTQGDENTAMAAAHLVGAWKTPHALALLREQVADPAHSVARHVAAIEGLREFGGSEAKALLKQIAGAYRPAGAPQRAAAVALAGLDLRGSLPLIVETLEATPDAGDRLTTWRGVLANKGASDAVAAALKDKTGALRIPEGVASSGLRAARELGRPGKALLDALTPLAGAAGTTASAPSAQTFANLADVTKRDGDPARGEEVFRRANLACLTCHAIGGAGGKTGPELTSLGASAPLDYIIESVLVPGAKVKEGYNAVTLTLKDGSAQAGIQSRETASEVFLRNAAGQETAVVKANIVSRENIGSIMPAGLTDQLQDRERLDLYAFLAQLGKPGVYDASKGEVARVWALLPANTIEKKWMYGTPAYTLVDGRLMKDRIAAKLPAGDDGFLALAHFQVASAGEAKFYLEGATAFQVDGAEVNVAPDGSGTVKLNPGEHIARVKINRQSLPDVLRLESPDVRFLGD